MKPTAKPKPAPKLRPRHSIQDLHSSPHATASSAPHPLAAQPRSAEHAPTLATGAPVGVHMLTHQLRPPPPFNQPRAQPAPILARGGLPVTQPSPLFPWFAEHCHPLPRPPCRPQPYSICQAPKPHSALRHEPTAAPLSSSPLDLRSRAQPGRAVAPRFRQAKLGPQAHSAREVHSRLAGPASTNWILLDHLCGRSCISGPVRGLRGVAPCIHTVHHCPVLQVHPRLFGIHRSTWLWRGRLASRAPSGPFACLRKLQAGRPQQLTHSTSTHAQSTFLACPHRSD